MRKLTANGLCLLVVLLIFGCGAGEGDMKSKEASSGVAASGNKTYGIFTSFTSARAVFFKVSGIKLINVNTRDSSMMAVNTEQSNIAIISHIAWPQGEPILTFDGDVSGEITLSNIEQVSETLQPLPSLIEVRAIK